ncbi:MAG: PilZ domain-containing protein [Granulosicoccaceae bacterium]|jgi:hypothetical protein
MRTFIRHPTDIPIEFNIVTRDDGGSESLNNIGRGGLRFTSRTRLKPGTALRIRIPGRQFEAFARVAWCRPFHKTYDIGVMFANQDDAYNLRMVEQVCHIEQFRRDVCAREGRIMTSEEAAQEWIKRFADDFPDLTSKH